MLLSLLKGWFSRNGTWGWVFISFNFFLSGLYICLSSPCLLASGVSEERPGDLLEVSGHQLLLSHCLPVALSLFCLGFDNQVWFMSFIKLEEFGPLFVNIYPFSLFLCVDTFDVIPNVPLLLSIFSSSLFLFLFYTWGYWNFSSSWPLAACK